MRFSQKWKCQVVWKRTCLRIVNTTSLAGHEVVACGCCWPDVNRYNYTLFYIKALFLPDVHTVDYMSLFLYVYIRLEENTIHMAWKSDSVLTLSFKHFMSSLLCSIVKHIQRIHSYKMKIKYVIIVIILKNMYIDVRHYYNIHFYSIKKAEHGWIQTCKKPISNW